MGAPVRPNMLNMPKSASGLGSAVFNVCTVTILPHSSLIADFEREMAIPKEPTQLRDEEDATVEAEGMVCRRLLVVSKKRLV